MNQTQTENCDKEAEKDSNEAMSEGEGKDSDEEIIARNNKQRRKEKEKLTRKQPTNTMEAKTKTPTMAGLVLPQPGDKSVAGEASTQRDSLTGNISKKTKQVRDLHIFVSIHSIQFPHHVSVIRLRRRPSRSKYLMWGTLAL